jgi:predicted phosphodiesterase
MKIALISDIHSNLPALEAVLNDLGKRTDVDAVYHLGDLVGYAPWPNEVVARIRAEGIAGIAGNYDSTTATATSTAAAATRTRGRKSSPTSPTTGPGSTSPETEGVARDPPFRMDVRPLGGTWRAPP